MSANMQYKVVDKYNTTVGICSFNPKTIKFEASKDINFHYVWNASLALAKTYNRNIRVFYNDTMINIINFETCYKVDDMIKCAVNAANKTKTTISFEVGDTWLNAYPNSTFKNVKKHYVILLNKQHNRIKGV